jgi:hypothetical protein
LNAPRPKQWVSHCRKIVQKLLRRNQRRCRTHATFGDDLLRNWQKCSVWEDDTVLIALGRVGLHLRGKQVRQPSAELGAKFSKTLICFSPRSTLRSSTGSPPSLANCFLSRTPSPPPFSGMNSTPVQIGQHGSLMQTETSVGEHPAPASAVVACHDAPPVLELGEEVLDLVALAIERLVVSRPSTPSAHGRRLHKAPAHLSSVFERSGLRFA